jgi:hypothetical protein
VVVTDKIYFLTSDALFECDGNKWVNIAEPIKSPDFAAQERQMENAERQALIETRETERLLNRLWHP